MELTYDSIMMSLTVFLVLVLPAWLIVSALWRELVSFVRNWR